MQEIKAMLEGVGLPFAYDHFEKKEAPAGPPFLCFLLPNSRNFAADGSVYQKIAALRIELYLLNGQVEYVNERDYAYPIVKEGKVAYGSYAESGVTVVSQYNDYTFTPPLKTLSSVPTQEQIDNAIWTMVHGDRETIQGGSRQTINVSWPRPGDGQVLETTFEILVAPGYTPGGGSTVEDGHGGSF